MATRPGGAEQDEIVAALCLRPAAEGQWLTGLLVAREHRRQGLAGALLQRALAAALAERLARYRRHQSLPALRAH